MQEPVRQSTLGTNAVESAFSMVMGLQLDAPHSATRFVLPFAAPFKRLANTKNRLKSGNSQAVYKRVVTPEKDALLQGVWSNIEARKSYLLKETEDVLFKHASWWVMDCKPAKLEMPTPDSHQVTAMVAPPAVVIFEDARGEGLLRTGFLIIEVNFCPGWRMDDQLLFNELFRYWREPYKAPRAHSEKFGPQISSFLTPFRAFTPASSSSGMDLYGERWMSALLHPLEDGRALIHSSTLCPDDVFGSYADDRAFVWTRAVRENQQDLIPGASIGGKWIPASDEQTGFRKMFGYWGKLLNVDQPSLHWDAGTGRPNGYNPQSETNGMTHFETEWSAPRTFRRWEHFGCYYGFNSFSGAMLSSPNNDPPTWRFWFEMYFDQILLLLYIRVILFKFSAELTRVTSRMVEGTNPNDDKSLRKWEAEFRELRRAFTCFENLYQFPLLSNQQQAIEMYELARKWMEIDALYREISSEITTSDQLLSSEVERRRNENGEALNRLATVGLALSVAFACYQVPSSDDKEGWWSLWFVAPLHSRWGPAINVLFWLVVFFGALKAPGCWKRLTNWVQSFKKSNHTCSNK